MMCRHVILYTFCVLVLSTQALVAQSSDVSITDRDNRPWVIQDDDPGANPPLGYQAPDGRSAVNLSVPGVVNYSAQEAVHPRGWEQVGTDAIIEENPISEDWRSYESMAFQVHLEEDANVDLTCRIRPIQISRGEYPESVDLTVTLAGSGWHDVVLPFDRFDYEKAEGAFWKFIEAAEVRVASEACDKVLITDMRLIRGNRLTVSTPIRSLSCEPDQSVAYPLTVENLTDAPIAVRMQQEFYGWEALDVDFSEQVFTLNPHESKVVSVTVSMNDCLAPGGFENSTICAIPGSRADLAVSLPFKTIRTLPHPYLMLTEAGWEGVREKMRTESWAEEEAARIENRAESWRVPQSRWTSGYVFSKGESDSILNCAIAWKLSGRSDLAEKAAQALRVFADPDTGYITTLRAINAKRVHEGMFFHDLAIAYDLVCSAHVLTPEDQHNMQAMFRKYLDIADWDLTAGDGNNHQLAFCCGAILCSLAIQDLERAERFLEGPHGLRDLLATTILDDGSYMEGSQNYNLLSANVVTSTAQAAEPWGLGLKEWTISPRYSKNIFLAPWTESERAFLGMSFDRYGPSQRNVRRLSDLWDSIVPLADYRGIAFATNDSNEKNLAAVNHEGGGGLDLAYRLWRNPAYVDILKQHEPRSLIYGTTELPDTDVHLYEQSLCQDSGGLAVLRSQAEQHPPREQIQAVLKYGTHGGYHGHFDRTGLTSLMRYGRSFYTPEAAWYGYGSYLFKMWVQTSVAHNMVVVDQRMQSPSPGTNLLFHSGPMMQVSVVETEASWIDPPYGGQTPYLQSFPEEKSWSEGRWLPVPEEIRPQGDTGTPSEPILQRRAMIVTDDYVLIADYLRADHEHTFDNLVHIKGLRQFDATDKAFLRHDDQFSTDPFGAGQFVTDCDWYRVTAPAALRFSMEFLDRSRGGGDTLSEPGLLNLDWHALWPRQAEIMVGNFPENQGQEKQLTYSVRGDGHELAQGAFGAWTLGRETIDVSIADVETLELMTSVDEARSESIFWGNAVLVTEDGESIPLRDLPIQYANLRIPDEPDHDYFRGPITIAGKTMPHAVSGNPIDSRRNGVVTVDLTELQAVCFQAEIGGDYPLGDQSMHRKTVSLRSVGREARFLTLLEPYEERSMIRKVEATSPESIRVELVDGRVQELTLNRFNASGEDISVNINESKDQSLIRSESTVRID
jgi:hypothetical protein